MITGHTQYKGFIAQQHVGFYPILKSFLENVKPSRILEIGTGGGGFILAVREILNNIGLEEVPIKTFEVVDNPHYNQLRERGIEVIIENLFDHSYLNLVKPEKIVPYIKQEGVTVVFCDGGHKVGEFNSIAPHIKKGDYLLAHDYVETWKDFQEKVKGKIWDWCEVEEKYIAEVSKKEGLEFYNKEEFGEIVWVCKVKK